MSICPALLIHASTNLLDNNALAFFDSSELSVVIYVTLVTLVNYSPLPELYC